MLKFLKLKPFIFILMSGLVLSLNKVTYYNQVYFGKDTQARYKSIFDCMRVSDSQDFD